MLGLFDSKITKVDDDSSTDEVDESTFRGKAVTSVPEYMTTLKASYTPPTGLGGSVTWRSIGEYYISGNNNHSYEGFDVVDMTAFYTVKGDGKDGSMKLYAQINNVLDETYAEAVWYSDDDETANYAPAAGRNFGIGLTMKY